MSKFICFSSLALAALIVPVAGCTGGSGAELVPVAGTVTVDGKPVEGITVTLLGDSSGEKRIIPYGQTDAEGKFTVKVSDTEMGAPAGEYQVLFQKLRLADGSPIPEGESAADVGAVNQLPEVYSVPNNNSLTATIPVGGTDSLTFDLKPKR